MLAAGRGFLSWAGPTDDRIYCLCRIMRPLPVPLTMVALSTEGAYLMDCGRVFVVWLGQAVSQDFITQVR